MIKRFSQALDQPSRARGSSIRYQIKEKKGASTSSILGRRVSKGYKNIGPGPWKAVNLTSLGTRAGLTWKSS